MSRETRGSTETAEHTVVARKPRKIRLRRTVRRLTTRRWRITRRLVFGLMVAGLALSAAWFATAWAESSETCRGCHATPAKTGGEHENIGCAQCHRQPGVLGALRYAVDYGSMLWSGYAVEEAPAPRGVRLESWSCLRCHRSVLDISREASAPVRVGHAHLLSAGFECADCHETAGHRESISGRPVAIMERCLRCHDGEHAASECDVCHTGRPSDVASGWRRTTPVAVGMGGTCRGCHSAGQERECIACHGGLEMPHPAGWAFGSGHVYDGFVNQARCSLCHKPPPAGLSPSPHGSPVGVYGGAFCNRCHTFPSPHGDTARWIRTHGPASRGVVIDQPACDPCHGPGHVQQCYVCHLEGTCRDCHDERDRRQSARGVH